MGSRTNIPRRNGLAATFRPEEGNWSKIMKKLFFMGLVLLILGSIGVDARAWVYVPNQGDTGWQTYVYTAGADGFTGTVGFVVSKTKNMNFILRK
jgi:hypothetical protein